MSNITLFAGNFAPKAWAMCDGSMLSISANTALFALIGTTYGGNGQTTFALPDFRGRVPVGTGTPNGTNTVYNLGQVAGTETNTMTSLQLPSHGHNITMSVQVPVADSGPVTENPGGAYFAQSTNTMYNATAGANEYMGPLAVTANLLPAGGSQPIPNMMAYIALNYIICTMGIFPSRN